MTSVAMACLLFWLFVATLTMGPVTAQGVTAPTRRIISGERITDRCKAPYNAMVALSVGNLNFCSGVQIETHTVLTSARCLSSGVRYSLSSWKVKVGELYISFQDQDEREVAVTAVKLHPGFNPVTNDNDIALVKLSENVTYSKCVQQIARAKTSAGLCSQAVRNCTLTGWGQLYGHDLGQNYVVALSGDILLANEELSTAAAGSSQYPTAVLPVNSIFGFPKPGENIKACYFDWGGMVACEENNQWILKGLISRENCEPGDTHPIIISDVAKFQAWIDTCLSDFNSPACTFLK